MGAAELSARSFPDPRFARHAPLLALVEPRLPAGELAHDRDHLARVYHWAILLAPEAGADPDLCGATALVHDLVFVPKDSVDRAQGGERSAAAAGETLAACGYAEADIGAIADAVRTSSWSRGLAPVNPIGVVLQDADRLDAIGAVGLMRNLACAQYMSRADRPGRFYHREDPLAASGRALDDRLHAVDHCFAKLLKLASGMKLPSAQAEARRRHAFLEAFLAELAREI
ncbi:MAG: phosphohydrolase [Planctomycetes bacterium]|nr:phosphohydrolase [Planctomycetota bacterium]